MAEQVQRLEDDVDGNQQRHERVEPGKLEPEQGQQAEQQRQVGVDVHGEVQRVGCQGGGIGGLGDPAQVAGKQQGCGQADEHDDNAAQRLCHHAAGLQPPDGLETDPAAR